MKNVIRLPLMIGLMALSLSCFSAEQPKDRAPAVAGAFYSADAAQLNSHVDGLMSRVEVPKIDGEVLALISPHAGYPFSGAVAAHSYAVVKGRHYKRVVIIGPSHVEAFGFSSVFDGESYATPLGKVLVDREFAKKLAASDRSIRLSSLGHKVQAQSEHAIEVQLPFLQRALGEFKIVPIVMGDPSYESSRALGMALERLLRNDHETLLVASSDLSHYHKYGDAVGKDQSLLNAIVQNDFLTVSRNLSLNVWEACGGAPIVTVMIAAQHMGGSAPRLLKYANSGDVTGDKNRVVGYAALVIAKGKFEAKQDNFDLTSDQKSELLKIARLSVESAVRERKLYDAPVPNAEILRQDRGAFVTLKKKGELRGCIGHTSSVAPLYATVRDVAALAALRDPRFPTVKASELSELEYEVSVLSPFRHVLNWNSVHVGQDGLLIRLNGDEGLLLPQVAVEESWDRETFLSQVSAKAGLPVTAWRNEKADLFTFTAVVFSDRSLKNSKP